MLGCLGADVKKFVTIFAQCMLVNEWQALKRSVMEASQLHVRWLPGGKALRPVGL
jgi:hypothetical protein